MKFIVATLFALTVLISGCASKQVSTAGLTNKEKEEVMAKMEEEESMVCRREKTLGSNMVKRRCITQAQYEKERLESQERAREMRRNSNISNTLGNDEM